MKYILKNTRALQIAILSLASLDLLLPIVLLISLGEFHPFLNGSFFDIWPIATQIYSILIVILEILIFVFGPKENRSIIMLILNVATGILMFVFLFFAFFAPLIMLVINIFYYSRRDI